MKKNESSPIKIYENQSEFEANLPKTVELLKTEDGRKVFLIGAVHFSLRSQKDVSLVIRNTKPSVVMLELCPQRKYILEVDEETLLREASTLDSTKIQQIIAEKGLVSGLFYVSFLRTNAMITKQLGVAPGGECRRAVEECKNIENCKIVLGDRRIDITMQRALKPLSMKEKLMLANVFSDSSIGRITTADVEAYSNRDTDYLKNLRTHFPSVYRAFVTERDLILAHNLMLATKMIGNPSSNVVGIVGMGHMNGVSKNFGKTTSEQIREIMKIDPGSPKNGVPGVFLKLLKYLRFLKIK